MLKVILRAESVTGAILALCSMGLLWIVVVSLTVLRARREGHRGYWWCLYVLGLHSFLSPVYQKMGGLGAKPASVLSAAYYVLTLPTGCEIPLGAHLGKRLLLGHTVGVVIHAASSIGDDCIVTTGVVIGGDGRGGVPRIGNSVFLGANAVVAGSVSIGDGATIGAGTVVVSDVPPFGLVVGNPGQVVKVPYHRPYHNVGRAKT